jgi:HAD superfamily hydrolase (TIGR01509 family)
MRLDVSRVQAVVFDMDDTLLDWRGAEQAAVAALAERHFAPLGIAVDRVRATYDGVMADNLRSWREVRRWWYISERLQFLSERLGTADRLPGAGLAQIFGDDVTQRLRMLDGAMDALRAARRGRRTAILTNGRSEVQRPKVHAFALEREVDFVGISGELGAWKPDPEAFRKVLLQLGVAPEAALMVGDNLDFDILPAKAIGMQTVWVGQGENEYADLVVQRPSDLVGHL